MASFGHSDAPVTTVSDDSLGIAPYAAALSDIIARCDTPMTVAIQGDWGTGKTSLMNMVREKLQSSSGARSIETIWFATWQYAQFGATQSLPVSLLSTLLRKMSGEDKTLLSSSMNVLRKLAKPALNIGLRVATAGSVEADDFGGGGGDTVDLSCNAEELKEDIAKLVAAKRSRGVERIVVFVDDLDRVPPARAVEILETIKLFVDLEGCVFVLALDYAVVRRGLKEKFGVAENDLGGRSFFDKIIQLPFSIPTARYDTDRFIVSLFERMALKMGPDDGDLFANLARASVSANPRGIKRVFNSLQLLIDMAKAQNIVSGDAQSDRLMVRNLFALLCMQNRFEPVHDWLIFNAQRLDAATLKGLDGTLEEDVVPDESLQLAMKALDTEQSKQFGYFARYFVSALQDPDAETAEVDDGELARFQLALTLTRVTAVGEEASAPLRNDPDFRWQNRELLKRLKTELTLGDSGNAGLSVTQPHSESGAYLYQSLDEGKWFTLTLYHGETAASISIESSQRRLNPNLPMLRELLSASVPLFDESESGKVWLWRHQFDGSTDIKQRESFIISEALPLFRAVHGSVIGKLR